MFCVFRGNKQGTCWGMDWGLGVHVERTGFTFQWEQERIRIISKNKEERLIVIVIRLMTLTPKTLPVILHCKILHWSLLLTLIGSWTPPSLWSQPSFSPRSISYLFLSVLIFVLFNTCSFCLALVILVQSFCIIILHIGLSWYLGPD